MHAPRLHLYLIFEVCEAESLGELHLSAVGKRDRATRRLSPDEDAFDLFVEVVGGRPCGKQYSKKRCKPSHRLRLPTSGDRGFDSGFKGLAKELESDFRI